MREVALLSSFSESRFTPSVFWLELLSACLSSLTFPSISSVCGKSDLPPGCVLGVFCPFSLSRLSNLDSPRSAGLLPQNQT